MCVVCVSEQVFSVPSGQGICDACAIGGIQLWTARLRYLSPCVECDTFHQAVLDYCMRLLIWDTG